MVPYFTGSPLKFPRFVLTENCGNDCVYSIIMSNAFVQSQQKNSSVAFVGQGRDCSLRVADIIVCRELHGPSPKIKSIKGECTTTPPVWNLRFVSTRMS